ncbi:MAG: hypothetical protein WDW38_003666 [Sanguina aurantia]
MGKGKKNSATAAAPTTPAVAPLLSDASAAAASIAALRGQPREKLTGDKDDIFGAGGPTTGRKRTEEGYAIYKEDELGLTKKGGGDTADCPFDCALPPTRKGLTEVQCINEVYTDTGMSLAGALRHEIGAVKAIGTWWSKKHSSNPVTLITQLSVGRLGQLEAQCRSWSGPLSSVVYTTIVQDPGSTALSVEAVPSMCVLDLTLVYEVYSDRSASLLYPFNILRNIARLQARTPVLAMLDGDLVISDSLAKLLRDETKASEIIEGCRDHTAFVLPIFAIPENSTFRGLANSKHLVDKAVRMEKPAFVELVHAGVFGVFDAERYTRGQGSTMTSQWYDATEPYSITSGQGYEPYILIDRQEAPFHDSRFRGYGSDKVSYISSVKHGGFDFKVHPEGWVIHRPHPKTRAR